MNDIERRLRDLGDRMQDEPDSGALTSDAIRSVKRRRLGTVVTGLVVVAALVFGATFAAGAFTSEAHEIGPARPKDAPTLIHYKRAGGYEGTEFQLTIERDGDAVVRLVDGNIDYTMELRLSAAEMADLEAAIDAVDWAAADGVHEPPSGVAVADGYHYELQHMSYLVLTESGADPPKAIADLTSYLDGFLEGRSASDPCGPTVDFKPTYLPEEWIKDLQPGSGGGAAWDVIGHYGNDAAPSTPDKAAAGFAELFAGESPYPLRGGEKIRVLDEPARFGPIHEGFAVEFSQHGCSYALVGYVEGEELKRFAQGLRLPGTYVPAEPSDEENFAAIWPEDSLTQAEEACTSEAHKPDSWRADPESVALELGALVLGWEEPTLIEPDKQGENGLVYELRRNDRTGPGVLIAPAEVVTGCWSIGHVSRLPEDQPKFDGSMSVRGREVSMGFDKGGAAGATFEVGYGGQVTRYEWTQGDPEAVEFRLDFEPRGTGHFLVLLRDAAGEVFSAFGSPLPEGDFAAG